MSINSGEDLIMTWSSLILHVRVFQVVRLWAVLLPCVGRTDLGLLLVVGCSSSSGIPRLPRFCRWALMARRISRRFRVRFHPQRRRCCFCLPGLFRCIVAFQQSLSRGYQRCYPQCLLCVAQDLSGCHWRSHWPATERSAVLRPLPQTTAPLALARKAQGLIHRALHQSINNTTHLLFHSLELGRYERRYTMHPQTAYQVDASPRLYHVNHISPLQSGRIDKLASLIIALNLEFLHKRLAQPSSRPCSYSTLLRYVSAVCCVPPEPFLPLSLLASSLGDVERVRGVRCDNARDVAGVCGRVADFEGLELELGEAGHYCLHTKGRCATIFQ